MEKNLNFDLFEKDISKINSDDLLKLREVHEGWFVEYKQESVSPKKYAKEIAAFANTYGGWLFVGIKENSKPNNVAGSYPGIDTDMIENVCQHIRQSVSEHLDPQPYFQLSMVDSPEQTNGEKIICVRVPPSNKAPIMNKDGVIYLRTNDASEPSSSRVEIDNLYKRTYDTEKFYADWFNRDPEVSENEKRVPYLRIICAPDYWNEHQLWDTSTSDELLKMIRENEKIRFEAPYNNIFSNSQGYTFRMYDPKDPSQLCMTMIFNRSLQNEILLPLSSFDVEQYDQYTDRRSELDEVVKYLKVHGYGGGKIIDLSHMYGAIDSFFALQRLFQEKLEYRGRSFLKYKLVNVHRHIPVVAAPISDLQWDEFSAPVLHRNIIGSPHGGVKDGFLGMNFHVRNDTDEFSNINLGTEFFIKFLNDVGLQVGSPEKSSKVLSFMMQNALDQATAGNI